MALTKAEINALSGRALWDAVVEQVLGWKRVDRAEVGESATPIGGEAWAVVVDMAWSEEEAGVMKIRSRSDTPDVTKEKWTARIIDTMLRRKNLRMTSDHGASAFDAVFALKAVTVTGAMMMSDPDYGTAVARASLLAVQA